jgi:hypothetical protein
MSMFDVLIFVIIIDGVFVVIINVITDVDVCCD